MSEQETGKNTLPPFEKRLFLGQCPHCMRTALTWDSTLESVQCEGCGVVWQRRNAMIAAAPALLAALEAIHAALNQPVHHSGTHTPETADVLRMDATIAREMALAAIKKAKGE